MTKGGSMATNVRTVLAAVLLAAALPHPVQARAAPALTEKRLAPAGDGPGRTSASTP